jgi:PKD domain
VTFHASFSRPAHGSRRGLRFVWDFGDGTHVVAGPAVTHTYARPTFADVRLAVVDGGHVGAYRQAVAVDSPSGPAPATDPCGTLSAPERAALVQAGHAATPGKEVAR